MNREIKFRAWDKCNERMIESRNILKICMSRLNQEPYLIVYLKKWMNENREIKESDKSYTNEFELMQYTGLKDKNGKEIYEGDIIEKTYYSYHQPECSELFEIKYEGLSFHFEHIKGNAFYLPFTEDIEVIGNIYEDGHLLKK